MRRLRRVLLVLALVALVPALLAGALWWYLGSPYAAARASARLEAVAGGPVQLDALDVGLGGTVLRGVRLFEPGAETPWATADELRADVSLWGLATGGAPQRITLDGAAVVLRFDKDGKLKTRLFQGDGQSGPAPAVRVERGRLTLRQEGRPDTVIGGITADFRPDGERLVLEGTVADPYWGDWTAVGDVTPARRQGSLTLNRPEGRVTQEMLDRLPFVPEATWQAVRAEGDTPVELSLRFAEEVHYRVALRPRNTRVRVTAIDLDADRAEGEVVIDDNRVTLRGVRGYTAQGVISTDADLDFRSGPTQLRFDVSVKGVDVRQLPASWSMPAQVEGRLTGRANLLVTVLPDEVRTRGEGDGLVNNARFAGLPARPIRLRLRSEGAGFRFSTQQPADEEEARREDEPVFPFFSPAEALSGMHEGVAAAARLVADAGAAAVNGVGRLSEPRDPKAAPSYLGVNLGLDDVDVSRLIQGLELELPFPVTGRVSLQVDIAVPLDTPRDLKAYRLRGSATSSRLALAGLDMEDLRARLTYRDGLLRLEELSGRIPEERPDVGPVRSGTFRGTATVQAVPRGDLDARVSVEDMPLSRALSLIPGAAERADGSFSGNLTFRSPLERLQDVTAWRADGRLVARQAGAFGLRVSDGEATVRLENGTLRASEIKGKLEGAPVVGDGELRLTSPYRYRARLDLPGSDLASLERLAPEARPPVALAGTLAATAEVSGALSPFSVGVEGSARAADLTVEKVPLGAASFRWRADADRFRVTDLKAAPFRGELTGSAVVPLRAAAPGRVDLTFQEVDLGALSRAVPSFPVALGGRASGSLAGDFPAAREGERRDITARLDVKGTRLRVQRLPAERLEGTLTYRDGALDYRLEGRVADGRLTLNGRWPPPKQQPSPDDEGRLSLEGARLNRLGEALGLGDALRRVEGTLDAEFSYRVEPDGDLLGDGRVVLNDLRSDGREIASSVRGDVRLVGGLLRVRDLTGTVAGGLLRGQAAYNLRRSRGFFSVGLERAEAARLLAPLFGPDSPVEGPVEVRLRGTFAGEVRGSGEVVLGRGRVAGVGVSDWRLPVDFSIARGSGSIDVREGGAQVAGGRASVRASYRWGAVSRLDGEVRFFNADLRTGLRSFGDVGQFGAGRGSGRFTFFGDNVRSADDVGGDLEASFSQAQPLGLPVLRQIAPLVAPGLGRSAQFQSGDVRARLSRGVVRVETLSLVSPAVQLFLQGTVTLQGRLNLEATANTAQLPVNANALRLLGLRVPTIGPIPVGLLLEISSFFANRVVHLRITGTVNSPVIRVEPLPILAQEAARFFLGRYTPAPGR